METADAMLCVMRSNDRAKLLLRLREKLNRLRGSANAHQVQVILRMRPTMLSLVPVHLLRRLRRLQLEACLRPVQRLSASPRFLLIALGASTFTSEWHPTLLGALTCNASTVATNAANLTVAHRARTATSSGARDQTPWMRQPLVALRWTCLKERESESHARSICTAC